MPRIGRQGMIIFLLIAGFIVIEKSLNIILALSSGLATFRWWKSLGQPLCFIAPLWGIWLGDRWCRWIGPFLYILSGAIDIWVAIRLWLHLSEKIPADQPNLLAEAIGYPLLAVCVYGALYILIGLALLILPSVQAFYQYRQESYSSRNAVE
jgi:hypothetical protein